MGVDLYFTNIVRIDVIKEKTDLKIEMQSNSEEYQDYLISDGEGEIYCYTNKGVVSFFKWGEWCFISFKNNMFEFTSFVLG